MAELWYCWGAQCWGDDQIRRLHSRSGRSSPKRIRSRSLDRPYKTYRRLRGYFAYYKDVSLIFQR